MIYQNISYSKLLKLIANSPWANTRYYKKQLNKRGEPTTIKGGKP